MKRKFKEGDVVERIGNSFIDVKTGGIYTVSEILPDGEIRLYGCGCEYFEDLFRLSHSHVFVNILKELYEDKME